MLNSLFNIYQKAVTYEELIKEFNKETADLVMELTSDKSGIDSMGKGPYLVSKMNKMSPNALLIKLADRLDNVSDFVKANPKWVEKYKAETNYILDHLKTNLTPNQQSLITKIKSFVTV